MSLKFVPQGPNDSKPATIWANDGLVYWRIYASLVLKGLTYNVIGAPKLRYHCIICTALLDYSD